MHVDRDTFENLVVAAMNALPLRFRERLSNLEIVVEEWPSPDAMRAAGARRPDQVMGLYQGVPLTRRTHRYGLILPDKISIYQRAIEQRCATEEQMRATVQRVLRHELAHHFGLEDERLREIEAY